MMDPDVLLSLPLLWCLWGCALIPRTETDCNATRPCPAGQACDPQTATCVQQQLADQGAPLPVQDLAAAPCVADGGGCIACSSHGQCPSLVCNVYQPTSQGFGQCIPAGSVIYVDNQDGTCSGMGGSGTTPMTAVCTIGQGLALLDGVVHTVLRVMPSTAGYGYVSLTRTAALYGPAGDGGTAQLGGTPGMDGVDISGASAVILDGFVISGSKTGVACVGQGPQTSLQLHRSQVTNSGLGVFVTGCALDVDRVLLQYNDSGALAVGGGQSYSVTNSFLVNNQALDDSTIKIVGAGPGSFRFNTVADNMSMLGVGMDCGGQQLRIQDSIFVRNQRQGGSQFQNGCVLANVVVGMQDNAPGSGIAITPDFTTVQGIAYGLNPSDPVDEQCCIDKAKGTISTDYFGTTRPQGTACDIGADEAK